MLGSECRGRWLGCHRGRDRIVICILLESSGNSLPHLRTRDRVDGWECRGSGNRSSGSGWKSDPSIQCRWLSRGIWWARIVSGGYNLWIPKYVWWGLPCQNGKWDSRRAYNLWDNAPTAWKMVDESGNPRIWNDTVWMAVCMRSVWHPDGAGQLCVYAENQPEYMDCLICSTVDSLWFHALYIVKNRNHWCDSGIFYPAYLLSDVSGAGWPENGMQLENGVSDDFKWHGSWSGHGIEVDRGIRLCGDCSPLFYIFVPGIWDSCGTDQKGNVWTGGDKLPGGAVCHLYRCIHFDSGSDLRCILSFLWKWYGKWKCFPDYVGKSAAYASLPWENGVWTSICLWMVWVGLD